MLNRCKPWFPCVHPSGVSGKAAHSTVSQSNGAQWLCCVLLCWTLTPWNFPLPEFLDSSASWPSSCSVPPPPVQSIPQYPLVLATLCVLPKGAISLPACPTLTSRLPRAVSRTAAMLIIMIICLHLRIFILCWTLRFYSGSTQHEAIRWLKKWFVNRSVSLKRSTYPSTVYRILWFNKGFYLILLGEKLKPSLSLNSKLDGTQ